MAQHNSWEGLPLAQRSIHHAGWSLNNSFIFDSDSASSSGGSTHGTSDDTHDHSDDWRYTSKYWTDYEWATIADRHLYERGFALRTKPDFAPKSSYALDPNAFFAERAASLDDTCQLYGIRLAWDIRHAHPRPVYVRAVIDKPGSDEIRVTKLLRRLRNHPHNFVVSTLDIIELTCDGVDLAFFVQEDAGQPSDCFEMLFRNETTWRKFILDCFEGLAFLHSLGIAHLDIGPTNVLYDPRTGRPTFIDFEGCHVHEGEIQKCTLCATRPNMPAAGLQQPQQEKITRKLGAPTATNARLPELNDPGFDVFAADVWCLGAMLRDMRSFPDDDLRAHFRSMCMKEPRARPTMAYALDKLKVLLASDTDLLF